MVAPGWFLQTSGEQQRDGLPVHSWNRPPPTQHLPPTTDALPQHSLAALAASPCFLQHVPPWTGQVPSQHSLNVVQDWPMPTQQRANCGLGSPPQLT